VDLRLRINFRIREIIGIIGNQDKKILKAASINPEINPAEEVEIPPDAETFDNPLITFDASDTRKT
jgi:hypothetical protein